MRRLNLNISDKAYEQLADLSCRSDRSMTYIIRLGVGLAKLALDAQQAGNRIVIANANGDTTHEVLIP